MARSKKTGGDVGVILCDCGGVLKHSLDFVRLKKEMISLNAVTAVGTCSRLCDAKECLQAITAVSKSGARRIVAAGCERERIEQVLRAALARKRLNDGLWWSVDLLTQAAPAHGNKKAGTEKAIELLAAAVARTQLAKPVKSEWKKVNRAVVIAGGGIAGLQSALQLANLDYRVVMLNAAGAPGGTVAAMPELYGYLNDVSSAASQEVRDVVQDLIRRVEENANIEVHLKTFLKSVKGEAGDFLVTASSDKGQRQFKAGAVVLATGFPDRPVSEAVAGAKLPGLMEIDELMQLIRSGSVPRRIAIVLDLVEQHNRAVSAQVLSAAESMAGSFGAQVKVFCNNVQVAATGLESLYRRARDAGVIFVKSGEKPSISSKGSKLVVAFKEQNVSAQICEEFEVVVMAGPDVTQVGREVEGKVAVVRAGPGGALQYDSVWLLPTLTNRRGVFVVGAARGNSEYREALTDGLAVAGRIHELLAAGRMEVRDDAAVVDAEKCVLCLTCLRICPHAAIEVDDKNKAARVSSVSCQRCGICAAECPALAIHLPGFTDEEINAEIGDNPRVTVFVCENSASQAASTAVRAGHQLSLEIQLVRVPCAGKVDARSIFAALEKGAKKVMIMGCHPENCRYLSGSTRAAGRIGRLAGMLEKAGFDASRVVFGGITSMESAKFSEYLK